MGWLIYNYKELYIFDLESFCVECFTPFFFNFYFLSAFNFVHIEKNPKE